MSKHRVMGLEDFTEEDIKMIAQSRWRGQQEVTPRDVFREKFLSDEAVMKAYDVYTQNGSKRSLEAMRLALQAAVDVALSKA